MPKAAFLFILMSLLGGCVVGDSGEVSTDDIDYVVDDEGDPVGPDAGAGEQPPEQPPDQGEADGANYPSPVPVKRFDVAGFQCPASGVCDASRDKCFCRAEFDRLNYSDPSHILAMGVDTQRPLIRGAGNYQAFYVNSLNYSADGTGWRNLTATARADEMMASCRESFPTGCPQWFLINEISASVWPNDANYRRWVFQVMRRLRNTYNRNPIVFSPFAAPSTHGADWQNVASVAVIGVENFLSGREIKSNGFSQEWCRGRYQRSLDAYRARGVAKSRLFLIEHFANNNADKTWGRAGVSDADWSRAIAVRSAAAHALRFPGFVSYCWACNELNETNDDRHGFARQYSRLTLP